MLRAIRLRSGLTTILAVALLSGCAAAGANKAGGKESDKPVVLKLANPFGDSEEVDSFTEEVGRLSGGTMRIDVKSRWRYGQAAYEDGLIQDVRAGEADLGIVGSRAWDSVGVGSFRALSAPFLIDSFGEQERVLTSPVVPRMLEGIAKLGLVGLGVLPGPLRYLIGTRPLLAPSDFAGRRIGVQQSTVGALALRSLGARPVWFPAGGKITGLDGAEQDVADILGNRYDVVAPYLTANVVLWPRPLVVFANRAAFTKLTPREQQILREAGVDSIQAQDAFEQSNQRYGLGSLCRGGRLELVSATGADVAALRRAVHPVYVELEHDPHTRLLISQIEAIRVAMPAEPPLSCSATRPASKPAKLDGVYEFTVTQEEMVAADADPSEIIPENLGKWVFVLDRGRFANTQVYQDACTWGYGTLTVSGNTLTLTFINGGGIAPDNAANKPGDQFIYDWSLYRDLLTLGRPPGQRPPTPWLAVPWRRVSASASRGSLSMRCPPPASALPG